MTWRAVCGGNYYDMEGWVTSPGYPADYGANLDCNYRMVGAGRNDYLILEFDVEGFEMEDTRWKTECRYDYLQVTDAITGQEVTILKTRGNPGLCPGLFVGLPCSWHNTFPCAMASPLPRQNVFMKKPSYML